MLAASWFATAWFSAPGGWLGLCKGISSFLFSPGLYWRWGSQPQAPCTLWGPWSSCLPFLSATLSCICAQHKQTWTKGELLCVRKPLLCRDTQTHLSRKHTFQDSGVTLGQKPVKLLWPCRCSMRVVMDHSGSLDPRAFVALSQFITLHLSRFQDSCTFYVPIISLFCLIVTKLLNSDTHGQLSSKPVDKYWFSSCGYLCCCWP